MLPKGRGDYPASMSEVLIVSDSALVRAEVRSALPEASIGVRELTRGSEVRAAVAERAPDLAVLDLQIGKMGGMATCLDLRLEESGGRLPHIPVLMLVDRRADVFLARRSGAEGWAVKPLDPLRLERAITRLLEGGRFEDDAYLPVSVPLSR
jgi:DNA-binding response OmpR family regulator